jgi:hypothetical protein
MNRGFISALSMSITFALLAGCGGSTSSVPGVPLAARSTKEHRASRSSSDFIYASGGCGGVCVLSYPQGQLTGVIGTSGSVGGVCSDKSGNVFVTNWSYLLEYPHGGTSLIGYFKLPGDHAQSCSVDPATNNVAVVFRATSGGDVAVYADEGGSPTIYSSGVDSAYCGYDNAGNLFVSGYDEKKSGLSELVSGHFVLLSIIGKLGKPGQVQWDGSYLTYESLALKEVSISRLTISGSVGTIVSTTKLNGTMTNPLQSWIYDGAVLVPYSTGKRTHKIGRWSYPQGGKPLNVIAFNKRGSYTFQGVTVSAAPSR